MTSSLERAPRRARRLRALLGALGALAACATACSPKSNGTYPTYTPQDASTVPVLDGSNASGSVVITIQSPTDGAILSSNAAANISAKIVVTGGGDIIDPATAVASLSLMGSTTIVATTPLILPSSDDVYTGKLSLLGVPTGTYTITVGAASSSGSRASKQVSIKIDAGPTITVLSPVAGQHYKSSLIVQVLVDPGAYGPLQAVPQASIGGMPLVLALTGAPNQYRAVFDLTMPTALTGDQLFEVSATDKNGTRTDLRLMFNVDITGPTITNTTPAAGQIVGGLITISAQIADGAGVNPSSIFVLIGDKVNPQFQLPLTLDTSGNYSTIFDTKSLTGCKPAPDPSLCIVFPTLSFRASDQLGNDTTVSYEILVDNVPPLADLTPPKIRDSKYDTSPEPDGGVAPPGLSCSFLFDPLSRNDQSGDMPDDGCAVPQVFDLRARIEDRGNRAAGLKAAPISLVDPDATAIYVLDDLSQPLVVDSDGDGVCDEINPNLTPTTMPLTGPRQVLKIRMKPVPPAGLADFTPDPTVPAGCIEGHATNPPTDICKIEEPTLAISYASGQPAIWGIEPIAPDNPGWCFGGQFDTLANNVATAGWKCIAVATADKNGNASVSSPIRVWVDYTYGGAQGWCSPPPASAPAPPTCTGTYNRTTGTATAGACTMQKFPSGEICFDSDC
ncbi:MAG TPA: Ig-like domain-containing protein [Polyangia bacterium]|nr:Ig-like domain-containing protein [Polyangia bacterium]